MNDIEARIQLCKGCEKEEDRNNCPYYEDKTLCPRNNDEIRQEHLYHNQINYGVKV